MKSPLPHLLCPAVLGVFFTGCQSTTPLRPPSADLRANLGRVAVVTLTDSPQLRVQIPDSRSDVLAEKSTFEAITPAMVVRRTGPASSEVDALLIGSLSVTTPLVVMGGAPLWQEIRRGYGLLVTDSAHAVATARATMDRAVATLRFEQALGQRLRTDLARSPSAPPLVSTRPHADTVLELMAYEPNLSGDEGFNPGLQLSLGLRVRLLDARTGAQRYYDYLDYRGPRHTFVTWAADDARLFRAEIERCLATLSAEIVAQLFTRPAAETVATAQLAAVGLSRRATDSVAASSASPHPPIYSAPRYARR